MTKSAFVLSIVSLIFTGLSWGIIGFWTWIEKEERKIILKRERREARAP